MKKETTKKSKLWLWIVIAAVLLLAAGGAALAFLMPGTTQAEQQAGPSVAPVSGPRADLYWNIDREFYTANSQTGLSTREADADGKFKMRFAYNGEIVELVIVDKKLVNIIDTQDVVGLTFDANGVVIGQINVRDLATEVGKKVYVKKTTSDTVYANSSMAMNGMELTLKMGQYAEIYDLRQSSENFGKKIAPTDLQVMDCVTVYSNNDGDITHVFLLSSGDRSKVYWRADVFTSSSNIKAAHVADADGIYTLDFYCEGERVSFKTKDAQVVEYVTGLGKHSAYTGLLFDENGFIVDILNVAVGLAGQQTVYAMDIEQIDGTFVKLKNNWSTSGAMNWEGTIPEDAPIYDVSSWAHSENKMGQKLNVSDLRLGDRLTIWSDMEGNVIHVLVTLRRVDLKPMFNNSSKYDAAAGKTTRTKDADGYWTYTFINEKGISKYKTNDEKLATFIDSFPERVFGIVTKGDKILKAYEYECIYGYVRFSTALYVDSINGPIISCTDQRKANAYTAVLAEGYKVLDISGDSEQWGQKIKLQVGDCMISFRDTNKEVCMIYVTKRSMGGSLYVNTTPNTSRAITTGTDGSEYWLYEMTDMNGKKVELKLPVGKKGTNGVYANKYLQSRIDGMSQGIVALEVSKGVIKDAHAPGNMASGNIVSSVIITKPGTEEFEYKTAASADATVYPGWTGKEGLKKVNLSPTAKEKGEKLTSKMQAGEVYVMVRNRANETVALFLLNPPMQKDLYFVKSYAKDPGGVYTFQVMYQGKAKTLTTADEALATSLIGKANGAVLKLDGSKIVGVYAASNSTDAYSTVVSNWDVSKISGTNLTAVLNIPTATTKVGDTKEIDIKGAKIYNLSPDAGDNFGKTTTLKKNDRIRVYIDRNGVVSYVHVLVRGGVKTAQCPHCNKKVTWNPLTAASGMGAGDAHYYIYDNMEMAGRFSIASETAKYDVVLDINGKTVTQISNDNRLIMVAYGSSLTILDSVGGGVLQGYGNAPDGEAGQGNVLQLSYGASLHLMSGTLKQLVAEGKVPSRQGGVIFSYSDANYDRNKIVISGGTIIGGPTEWNVADKFSTGAIGAFKTDIEMSGGKITGGTADRGGNINLNPTSTFTMTGGEISNGTARNRGGNIFGDSGSVITIKGGKIIDGTSNQQGGNIAGHTVYMEGGLVSGGNATNQSAGNIFLLGSGNGLFMSGGEISNGTGNYGGNVYVYGGNGQVVISGGKVVDGTARNAGNNIYIYGLSETDAAALVAGGSASDPVILDGGIVVANHCAVGLQGNVQISNEAEGLKLTGNAKLLLDTMASTSKVYVTASGRFATTMTESTADISTYPNTIIFSTDKRLGTISFERDGDTQWLVAGKKDQQAAFAEIPSKAVKMTTDGVFNAGGIVEAECPYCMETVKWAPMSTSTLTLDGGEHSHYYLAEDITLTDVKFSTTGKSGSVTCLHLNGKSITQTNSKTGYLGALAVMAGTTMNIMGNGNVTGAGIIYSGLYGGGAIDVRGTVNLFGGKYMSNVNRPAVAIFAASSGNLNMYAGEIVRNPAVTEAGNEFSSNVRMYDKTHTFNLYGGTISGGVATNGGNIMVAGGTFNVYGGNVDGGVYVGAANVTINNGAKIAATNGGMILNGATVTLADNLASGTEVNISDVAGDEAALTKANSKAQDYVTAGYIKSANPGRPVKVNGENKLYIESVQTAIAAMTTLFADKQAHEAYCPVCSAYATWTPITNEYLANTTRNGSNYVLNTGDHPHYYLAEDIVMPKNGTAATRLQCATDGTAVTCLHLNGKKLDQDAGTSNTQMGVILISNGTTMNIMGDGEVIGVGLTASGMFSGAVDVRGTANIYGGTYKSSCADRPAVALFSGNAKEINMYGGTITKGAGTMGNAGASNVWLNASAHVFNMYGGTIENGVGQYGGNVRMKDGRFNMYGGTITGGEVNTAGGNIAVLSGTFDFKGGTITGGKVGTTDNNFHVSGAKNLILRAGVNGGVITSAGMVAVNEGAKATVHLKGNGYLFLADNLTAATEIFVIADASMTIATEAEKAAEYVEAGIVKTTVAGATITADGTSILFNLPVAE